MRQFFKFFLASCLGTLVALGILIILLAGIGSAMALTSSGGKTRVGNDQILHITVDESIPEKTDNVQNPEFSFVPHVQMGLHDISETIEHAAKDDRIKGIFLDVNYTSPGLASSQVIRRALDSFQMSGKWVFAYGDAFSQGGYHLASTADSIYLNPIGSIDFRGFASFTPFVRGFMEKLGLDFEIYYAGDYKSATEPFRRNEMSPENRLQMREFLEETYDLYLSQISDARQIDKATLRDIAHGFKIRTAEDAIQYDFVDKLVTREDVYAAMAKKVGLDSGKRPPLLKLSKYYETVKPTTNFGAKDKIAVVYAEGEINDSQEAANGIIQGDKYAKVLRKIRNDEKIKAVVLRVNSPGGSVLASSKILAELDGIQASGKKLVVSMGNYAASGGYYIACHADKILAEPSTLTGSIGVFSMVLALDETFNDKLDIHFDSLGTGPYATRFTPYFDWDEREDVYMQASTDRQYEKFLNIVAEGRDMSRDEVHAIAQGRIWTGRKAVEIGLVDELGDLNEAIGQASDLAGISEYRIVEYPFVKDPMAILLEQLTGEEDLTGKVAKAAMKEQFGAYAPQVEQLMKYKDMQGIQARLPFVFTYQ